MLRASTSTTRRQISNGEPLMCLTTDKLDLHILLRYYYPFYAMLLVAATPFILLPALYVIFKHLLNINSMNYYVAQKGGVKS